MAFGKQEALRPRKWYSIAASPLPCERGFHASEKAIDALQYGQGTWFSVVSLDGIIVPHGGDKLCAQKRMHHKYDNVEMVLHEFACWCAERALRAERKVGREPHPDSWKAIRVKRQWMKGKVSDEELAAAWAAAGAAWAAARAARDAAWDAARAAWAAAGAARAAAQDAAGAAWAAAGAAAWAAWDAAQDARAAAQDAAWAAAWDAQNRKLTALLMEAYNHA